MPSTHARIATADGSRLIKRLLTHWGHRFQVELQERHGRVPFDADTVAEFEAGADALQARITAADPERLARMQDVVAEHLQRMARGETLEIAWQPVQP